MTTRTKIFFGVRFRDGRKIGIPDTDWGREQGVTDDNCTKLRVLKPGGQFLYVFDFGDDWIYLCTVAEQRVDPSGRTRNRL